MCCHTWRPTVVTFGEFPPGCKTTFTERESKKVLQLAVHLVHFDRQRRAWLDTVQKLGSPQEGGRATLRDRRTKWPTPQANLPLQFRRDCAAPHRHPNPRSNGPILQSIAGKNYLERNRTFFDKPRCTIGLARKCRDQYSTAVSNQERGSCLDVAR